MSVLVEIMEESGYESALEGLALSYRQDPADMPAVAERLAQSRRGSERKFLRQMTLSVWIVGPEYWWAQMDTYKVGTVRQSSSLMHTALARPLTEQDFSRIDPRVLAVVNDYIAARDFDNAVANMPRSYRYECIWTANYEVLRAILLDRQHHKLVEWHEFIAQVRAQVQHPELLPEGKGKA
jgi:hypothetical protein